MNKMEKKQKSWKTIQEGPDLIVMEKSLKKRLSRIEARRGKGRQWNVYRTLSHEGDKNYVEEYRAYNEKHLKELLHYLREKSQPSARELLAKNKCDTPAELDFRRMYKEEYVEKWIFSVNKEGFVNFLIARFDSAIELDVVMHDSYKPAEKTILKRINELLGLLRMDVEQHIRISYFNHYVEYTEEPEHEAGEILFSFMTDNHTD